MKGQRKKGGSLECPHVVFRVYATYKNGPFASRLGPEMADLATWSNEVLAKTFARQVSHLYTTACL